MCELTRLIILDPEEQTKWDYVADLDFFCSVLLSSPILVGPREETLRGTLSILGLTAQPPPLSELSQP
jgi:hypothetical protein